MSSSQRGRQFGVNGDYNTLLFFLCVACGRLFCSRMFSCSRCLYHGSLVLLYYSMFATHLHIVDSVSDIRERLFDNRGLGAGIFHRDVNFFFVTIARQIIFFLGPSGAHGASWGPWGTMGGLWWLLC